MSKIIPFVSFVFASVIVAFGLGVFITEFKLPPYRDIAAGAKTLRYAIKGFDAPPYRGQFLAVDPAHSPDEAAAARFTGERAARFPGNILMIGGLNEYLEVCPGDGCIAVETDRDGNIVHGYPYRPDAIFAADSTGGSFYREGQPADPRQIKRPIGMQQLPGGDLIVSFQTTGPMFPYTGGIARIDRDGNPIWYRFDYSHHWVTVTEDGRVLVPDLTLAEGDWDVPVGPRGRVIDAFCETGRPMVDGIQELDLDGNVVATYDIVGALEKSPWVSIMVRPFNACDPLHINYVDVLDSTAPGGDLAPGNMVISSRNLSAIFVYSPEEDRITRVIKGTFQQQHSVHHLEGGKALLFDNWGGSGAGNGSRLLEVDLAGGPERQVFPNPNEPAQPMLFSDRAGHLDISPDRNRALVSFTEAGIGVEVDLTTRSELMRYQSLHDLRDLDIASDAQKANAVRSKLFGMYYVGVPEL
ncbi:arylsulfotransferase family protein [Meridianimarinicoccus aquatilis]|uniref:Aryl sulfotransferase n=1 Tax=Meridianimarinicoccus aquatilis TaxID=2552766 RepID=A0A4R6AWJ1_9RHOB|nr:arylsulfotransferase family protein [Fluviibacterium aquatile]QIE43979.1 hypothetical protein G5B39_18435 [Rhodobacteraceae bacterium SC52]TDL86393.1 hypothetical protein E2L05_13260 [Fluviibacterium aquatile]